MMLLLPDRTLQSRQVAHGTGQAALRALISQVSSPQQMTLFIGDRRDWVVLREDVSPKERQALAQNFFQAKLGRPTLEYHIAPAASLIPRLEAVGVLEPLKMNWVSGFQKAMRAVGVLRS